MTVLSTAVDHIMQLVSSESLDQQMFRQAARDVWLKGSEAAPPELNTALQRLKFLVARMDFLPASILAVVCGAMIEHGADPEIPQDVILQRTLETLPLATAFAHACQQKARNHPDDNIDPDDINECVENYTPQIAEEGMREEVRAWLSLESFCRASLTISLRLLQLHKKMPHTPAFSQALTECPMQSNSLFCLREVLDVLNNEELLVLYPALQRGYRIRISGIGNNFQLHTLLADALIGDTSHGWLPGERPDPLIVAAAKDGPFPLSSEESQDFPTARGAFNLWNWQGLQSDGSLLQGNKGHEHWIWNEGKPADIAFFEGMRIILLSPPPYGRGWNAGRYFPDLKGELEVIEQLSHQQVNDWILRIAKAAADWKEGDNT